MDSDANSNRLTPVGALAAGSAPVSPGALSNERVFVEHLKTGGYHPIVFFGTQLSGKTALLLSLLAYATHSRGMADKAHVQFAEGPVEDLFPRTYKPTNDLAVLDATAEKSFLEAKRLYDDG